MVLEGFQLIGFHNHNKSSLNRLQALKIKGAVPKIDANNIKLLYGVSLTNPVYVSFIIIISTLFIYN